MNVRKLTLTVGLVLIAIICFFPPTRPVVDTVVERGKVIEVTDYYKLATWIFGIIAITVALVVIGGLPQVRRREAALRSIGKPLPEDWAWRKKILFLDTGVRMMQVVFVGSCLIFLAWMAMNVYNSRAGGSKDKKAIAASATPVTAEQPPVSPQTLPVVSEQLTFKHDPVADEYIKMNLEQHPELRQYEEGFKAHVYMGTQFRTVEDAIQLSKMMTESLQRMGIKEVVVSNGN
jgi:hypothetical protein